MCTCEKKASFCDDYEAWEANLKAAILEKQWMNDRLTWYTTFQSILFAAYGLIIAVDESKNPDVVTLKLILAALGIVISFLGAVLVVSASTMHYIWHKELKKISNKYCTDETGWDSRFTFGRNPGWPAWVSRIFPVLITLAPCGGWIVLICISR